MKTTTTLSTVEEVVDFLAQHSCNPADLSFTTSNDHQVSYEKVTVDSYCIYPGKKKAQWLILTLLTEAETTISARIKLTTKKGKPTGNFRVINTEEKTLGRGPDGRFENQQEVLDAIERAIEDQEPITAFFRLPDILGKRSRQQITAVPTRGSDGLIIISSPHIGVAALAKNRQLPDELTGITV